MNDHLFGKELFIRFTVRVFREFLSNFVCVLLFLFDIEGGMWDVTLLIPDHAFLFTSEKKLRISIGVFIFASQEYKVDLTPLVSIIYYVRFT